MMMLQPQVSTQAICRCLSPIDLLSDRLLVITAPGVGTGAAAAAAGKKPKKRARNPARIELAAPQAPPLAPHGAAGKLLGKMCCLGGVVA